MRNQARREEMAAGKVAVGDGKDVHHVKPLSQGGTNAKSNRKVVEASVNRSFPRNPDGSMKRKR